jgi:glycosyltransferase involved in cell wall biosynthesis
LAGEGRSRILFINDHLGYPGGSWHGVTRYCVDVLPSVDPSEFEITACFLRPPHPAAAELERRGLRPIFLGRSRADPRALTDIVRLVRDRGIQALHLGGNKASLLGRIAARRTDRPAIIHLHDINPLGPVLGFLQRRVAPWTSRALAVSESAASAASDRFGIPTGRVILLRNGVAQSAFEKIDPGAGARIRSELRIREEDPVVGIVGRLAAEKGHDLLLRAWPSLLEVCKGAILVVVGDGPTRQACESLVSRLGIESRVRFTGHRGDVGNLLAVMHAVAVPSKREGFGYAALEALAAGKPVVGFRVGGLQSIVEEGRTGFLVRPGDGASLVQALTKVLNDKDLRTRLGEQSLRRAGEFTLEAHVRRLEEIYRSVIREGVRWARSSG